MSFPIKNYHPVYDGMSQNKTQTQYQSKMNSNSVSQLNFPWHFSKHKKTL